MAGDRARRTPSGRRSAASTSWAFHVAKIVEDNPTALLPSTRPDVGQPRPATEDDLLAALARADDRVGLMIELGAYVGLRCCEIAKAHTGDMRQDIIGDWVIRVPWQGPQAA